MLGHLLWDIHPSEQHIFAGLRGASADARTASATIVDPTQTHDIVRAKGGRQAVVLRGETRVPVHLGVVEAKSESVLSLQKGWRVAHWQIRKSGRQDETRLAHTDSKEG